MDFTISKRLKAVELFTVYRAGDLQKFISGNNLFIFPNREGHLDEEATEDAALVRVMREEEEQAVAENSKGTKEPW